VTAPVGLGLARVTVTAPKRRLDVALPDGVLVGELLPHLLRHAGEELADDGERHGGWVLHRATGTTIEAGRTLAAQGVRDGEVLHLVPRRVDWPELAYDDVVEVIAGAARRAGRSWGGPATRACGLAATSVVLALGVLDALLSGPPWVVPALACLALAAALLIAGIVVARAGADAVAGAVLAGGGMLYGFTGGLLVAVPPDLALTRIGAPHLLLGSAVLLACAVLGYVGVAGVQRIFTAGMAAAVSGLLAALFCTLGMSSTGSAALTLTIVIGLLPGYPLVAGWIGKLPMPALPDRPEQILGDQPVPERSGVFAAVSRSAELLAGFLLSASIVALLCMAMLAGQGATAGTALAITGALALLLRGRLFPTPRQRVPLLLSGGAGLALLAFGQMLRSDGAMRLILLVVIAVAATVTLASGLVYSRRSPSPYIGRLADIVDVLAIMALLPLAAAVLGVYSAIQGLFASIGG
jgi:type VII secretion integral membrane protein EccD